jgi:transcriptional regulator with XRE-family HTH domain
MHEPNEKASEITNTEKGRKMPFAYRSYSFVDKDPIIDYIRTIIAEGSLTMREISDASGVSIATISNWLYGKTKRPQAASLNAVLRVLQYQLSIVKLGSPMMITPTPFVPKANEPEVPRRLGAAKYIKNVHHISVHRKK